jgi:hypothetical protein
MEQLGSGSAKVCRSRGEEIARLGWSASEDANAENYPGLLALLLPTVARRRRESAD